MKKLFPTFTLLLFLSFAHNASASPAYYYNESDFLMDAGTVSMESFEDTDNVLMEDFESVYEWRNKRNWGDFRTITDDARTPLETIISNILSLSTDGDNSLYTSVHDQTLVIFEFDSPIHSFGLNLIELTILKYPEDITAEMSYWDSLVMITGSNGASNIWVTPLGGGDATKFFGVTSETPFTQISLAFTKYDNSAYHSIYLDEVYYEKTGTHTPIPSTVSLLGLGLLALTGLNRREIP